MLFLEIMSFYNNFKKLLIQYQQTRLIVSHGFVLFNLELIIAHLFDIGNIRLSSQFQ